MRIENIILKKDKNNQNISIIDKYDSWTYAEIYKRINELKNKLILNGLCPQDKVILIAENSAFFIIGMFGILAAGGVVIPIDPQFPSNVINEHIERFSVKNICIAGEAAETLLLEDFEKNELHKKLNLFIESKNGWGQTENIKNDEDIIPDKNDNEPALILLSSGTTGKPKGIVLSHRAVCTNVNAIVDYMKPVENDIFYIIKTMYHSSTITGELLIALISGAVIVAKNTGVSPNTILKRIEVFKPTIMCLNPTILKLLITANTKKYNISSLKKVFISGAIAKKDLLDSGNKIFKNKIFNVYGVTEASPRLTAQRIDDDISKYGSVGKAIKGVQIVVKNKDEICGVNETGIVYAKTPSIMDGYWNEPELTGKKINNGWLNTGDFGYIDQDGDLFIIGRSDDMIINGSHNVNPNYIEDIILEIPGIFECVVFGIQDSVYGNKIISVYVNDKECSVKKQDILNHCQASLARYQCPHEIYQWDKIPKSKNGKISRKIIRDLYHNLHANIKS